MALADRYDCFLFDLDGVLYRGDRAVPLAAEAVARLRSAGGRVVFMTNNSSRTPERVAQTLAGLGIGASPSEIVSSALATADLLASRGGGSAFVVGEEGIRTALSDAGVTVVDGQPERVDHVVVGWDRSADYAKLRTASLLVQRGAALVATNADPSYPAPDGLWPGAGALLAVIVTTTVAGVPMAAFADGLPRVMVKVSGPSLTWSALVSEETTALDDPGPKVMEPPTSA